MKTTKDNGEIFLLIFIHKIVFRAGFDLLRQKADLNSHRVGLIPIRAGQSLEGKVLPINLKWTFEKPCRRG